MSTSDIMILPGVKMGVSINLETTTRSGRQMTVYVRDFEAPVITDQTGIDAAIGRLERNVREALESLIYGVNGRSPRP
ncbi:hypothetical protein [Solidesulfovibrio sp.]|uniref:hypothetical protein n=1 Tax=Solidesulfovibrio sp. TaxID=2910990 RepID=UPI00261FDEAD|nr:hypothetical protein [Solidesulfovibrio sp.]